MFEYWHVGGYNITVMNKWGDVNLENDIPNLYRLGEVSVFYHGQQSSSVCEQLTPKEFVLNAQSKLTKHSKSHPVFVKYNNAYDRIKIYPYPKTVNFIDANGVAIPDGSDITTPTKQAGVMADYIKKPLKPNWGYVVVNDKPLYNSNTSQDFELHTSEESELVYRILAYVGIAIEKPQLTQMAVGLEQAKVQQEKQ